MTEKNEDFKEKEKQNISLFVIHNLITYKSVRQVKEYINGIHYTENFGKKTIYHLIYADEGSKAGEYYNQYTLKFIESYYKTVANLNPYDLIETVKDNFIELSNDILEKTENPITKENFDNLNNNIIKLSEVKDVILKKC